MVNDGTGGLTVLGGYDCDVYSSSLFQLKLSNGVFKWQKMKQELKVARGNFMAMTIGDDWANCQ